MSSMLPAAIAMVVLLPPLGIGQGRANLHRHLDDGGRAKRIAGADAADQIDRPRHQPVRRCAEREREPGRPHLGNVVSHRHHPDSAAGTVGAGTTRAYWDGRRLVAWRAGNVQGQTVSIKETFELNADASELIVETTVEIQHGYTMKGAKNYASSRDVFTKKQ